MRSTYNGAGNVKWRVFLISSKSTGFLLAWIWSFSIFILTPWKHIFIFAWGVEPRRRSYLIMMDRDFQPKVSFYRPKWRDRPAVFNDRSSADSEPCARTEVSTPRPIIPWRTSGYRRIRLYPGKWFRHASNPPVPSKTCSYIGSILQWRSIYTMR